MEQVFVPFLVTFTSVGAYLVGRRGLRLSARSLRTALVRSLEFIGTSIVFFVGNLAAGLTIVLAVRTLTGAFLSAYLLNDIGLVFISSLQGLLFQCWRGSRPPTEPK
jgi:hypothetical protein